MIKSHKIRIYPTKEQEELIHKTIGCTRFVYNYFLRKTIDDYENGIKYPGKFGFDLKSLKEEYEWLNDVSNYSLRQSTFHLDAAFKNFFRRVKKKQTPGFPKFKSKKKSKLSYSTFVREIQEKFLRIDKLGLVKYKTDFQLPFGRDFKLTDPVISYHRATNKYFISFGIEVENQNHILNDYSVGIDLGIKELAVIAYDGNSKFYHNINKSKKMKNLERRLKTLQRSISRKYEANKQGKKFIKTKNIEKAEHELRKLYNRIANIRDNYIHQTTAEIIKLYPKRIVMEDLNVAGMMKNKHLSKSIQQQNFNKFITYMKYKCEFNGIEFLQVDRFYPSSKTCSCCGAINKHLKLKDRIFICPDCGSKIDRDLNAAINLSNYQLGY